VPENLYIGVDGGGTGCRARFEDGAGKFLGAGVAGPATLRLGVDASLAAILTACRAALAEAGLAEDALARTHAGIGVAGIGRKGVRGALDTLRLPFASASFVSDADIACLGAHGGRDGGIVIVGTGSIAIARLAGADIRIGGYGFPISDEGSGADLGLRVVRLALRAADGRAESSQLLRDVMARFGGDPFAAVAWMDRASATEYATFAPLVMRHAEQGDPVGRRIVKLGAEHIDAMIRALAAREVPRISMIGGLASAIEPWLSPDVRRRLSAPLADAVAGALLLARAGKVD
jgi:glucosamine kinase